MAESMATLAEVEGSLSLKREKRTYDYSKLELLLRILITH